MLCTRYVLSFSANTTLSASDSIDQATAASVVSKCPEVGINQERPDTGECLLNIPVEQVFLELSFHYFVL